MQQKKPDIKDQIQKIFNIKKFQSEGVKWMPKKVYEDEKYIYYFDNEGRKIRAERDYVPRQGFIRLKFFEAPYRWWRIRSSDARNAIIPLVLSVCFGVVIYNSAVYVTEREAAIVQKAQLPEEYTEENFKKHQETKKVIDEWKKKKEIANQQKKD